jgi:D-xylose transport system permease protein
MDDRIKKDETTGSAVLAGKSPALPTVEIPSTAAVPPRSPLNQLLGGDLGFIPVLLTLIVVAVFFGVTTGGVFFEPRNISNLIVQISTIATLSVGVTLVLLLGEIDLSLASVSVLAGVVMGVLSERAHLPASIAIIAAILSGSLIGFVNGIIIAIIRVPSFIVTLAASIAYEGLLLYLLAGQSTLILNDPFINAISGSATSYLPDLYGIGLPTLVLLVYVGSLILTHIKRQQAGLRTVSLVQLIVQIVITTVIVEGAVVLFESYLGVPYAAAILVGLILIVWFMLTKTTFGRHIYAVGGNAEASRRAGINVTGIRIAVFTLCSTLAAIGGILAASHANSVASQISATLLLQAIAAAVIGGVSLFGGRGSVWSILLGALIIGSLENGLDLKSQGTEVKDMIEGLVLVLAVIVDALVRRAQTRSGR